MGLPVYHRFYKGYADSWGTSGSGRDLPCGQRKAGNAARFRRTGKGYYKTRGKTAVWRKADRKQPHVLAGTGCFPAGRAGLPVHDKVSGWYPQSVADRKAEPIAPHLSARSYEEMCVLPQYFYEHEGYRLDPHEVLVDCGAYTGDTLEGFLKICDIGEVFSHAYAFEMDKDNFVALNTWVQGQEHGISEKITTYNAGVWKENGTLSYGKMASSDSFSIFNLRETVTADTVRLDYVLGDRQISLLKMDIEGAEKLIKSQKPKLAICVYHRIEDLWEIPIMLKKWVPEYSSSIRHHAKWWVSETVCYAWVK